jgi:hypothetical protein
MPATIGTILATIVSIIGVIDSRTKAKWGRDLSTGESDRQML